MRGDYCPPRHDKNVEEYLSEGEEYAYLYKNGQWICYTLNQYEQKAPEMVEIPAGALAV